MSRSHVTGLQPTPHLSTVTARRSVPSHLGVPASQDVPASNLSFSRKRSASATITSPQPTVTTRPHVIVLKQVPASSTRAGGSTSTSTSSNHHTFSQSGDVKYQTLPLNIGRAHSVPITSTAASPRHTTSDPTAFIPTSISRNTTHSQILHPRLMGQQQTVHDFMPPEEDLSDDEDLDEFYPPIDNHVNGLFTGNGVSYTFDEDPLLSLVPDELQNDIKSGKFVDLGILLASDPFNMVRPPSASDQVSLTFENNTFIAVQQASKPNQISNIAQWTTAFLRYASIYATNPANASQFPALMRYAEHIRDLAYKRPGPAFWQYDLAFRKLKQKKPFMPWDHIHSVIWQRTTTQLAPAPQTQSFRPNRSFGNKRGRFIPNTCFRFNEKGICRHNNCQFAHVCGLCKGDHSALSCAKSKPQRTQPNQATSATNLPAKQQHK